MKDYYYIYETTNLINGKTYIGQHITKNLNDGYIGSGKALKKSITKYGKNNFKKEILMFVINQAALNFIEKCLVPIEWINGVDNYNLVEGGGSMGKRSEDVKNKISRRGKKHSLESRQKMSASHKGKKMRPESIQKSVLARSGNKCSLESRQKMRDSRYKSIEKLGSKLYRPFPDIINIFTGEAVINESNQKLFAKKRGLNHVNLNYLLRGKIKNYKGWILL